MRRALVLLALLGLRGAAASAAELTVDEVVAMAEAGVSEEILLAAVKGQTFSVGDAEIARLRKAGVSERVIEAMRGAGAANAVQEARASVTEDEARRQEELARERDRLRRKAEELKGVSLAARRADAELDAAIERAYDDLTSRRYAAAAVAFDRMVSAGALAPNTVRRVDASYGLALALARLGLPSAAAPHLVEVLRHGPEAPRYAEALGLLARWAGSVDYTHPILEILDGHDLGAAGAGVDDELRDEHALLVGGYRARFGDWDRARTRLESVRSDGARGPAAAYRLGLVEVAAGRPLEGLRAFERAVELAERRRDGGIRDLAYLSLARIAYEVGRWDAAADYYRRIPVDSLERADARHELVWTLLLSGDDLGALAALEAADSPRHRDLVAPDLGVIEATIYLDLCWYDEAVARADAFLADTAPLRASLEALVEREPADAYARALADPTLRAVLAADVDTHVAAAAAAAVQAELAALAPRQDAMGEMGGRIRQVLDERRRVLGDQAASAALRRLRAFRLELAELAVNAEEVKLEVELAKRELLQRPIGAEPTTRPSTALPAPREDEMPWAVDEERWIDEEDWYRTTRPSRCAEAR